MVKPIILTDGCSTTVYCEGDYDLVIFDEKTDTVFGQYSADGLCDARTQTWQVAVDAGFQAFKRLYGMCTYLRGNNDECTPHKSTHTFFLAYSNDFDRELMENVRDVMKSHAASNLSSSYFTHFAAVRFDPRPPAPIFYTTNWTYVHDFISLNLPEPSLRLLNDETGSDVLERSTGVEHSEFVQRLREFNIHLYIFFSTTPYGTPDQSDLYDLAAKTNGFFAYNDEENFDAMMTFLGVSVLTNPYQIYAVNRDVSDSGKISLPSMNAPFDDGYWSELSLTFGDQLDSTDSSYVVVTWTATNKTDTADSRTCEEHRKGNNYCSNKVALPENKYNMEVEYKVSKPATLMVRFYSQLPTTHWIPFDL
ncbi:unnamed protein product [Caenorhabditis brenneri]